MKHYLQVTDDHHAMAAAAKSDRGKTEALQNALQHDAKPAGMGPQPDSSIVAISEDLGENPTGPV